MDKIMLLDALDVPAQTPLHLTGLALVQWGRELHFAALAAPGTSEQGEAVVFEMHFVDCREARWQHYTHMDRTDAPAFPRTLLVNFKLGKDQHRSPGHLLTGHFGLSLYYGALWVLRGAVRTRISPE